MNSLTIYKNYNSINVSITIDFNANAFYFTLELIFKAHLLDLVYSFFYFNSFLYFFILIFLIKSISTCFLSLLTVGIQYFNPFYVIFFNSNLFYYFQEGLLEINK